METRDQISKLVDEIIDGNNSTAGETFNSLVSNKVTGALDQRKRELAQTIFNREQETEEESQ